MNFASTWPIPSWEAGRSANGVAIWVAKWMAKWVAKWAAKLGAKLGSKCLLNLATSRFQIEIEF